MEWRTICQKEYIVEEIKGLGWRLQQAHQQCCLRQASEHTIGMWHAAPTS